MERLPPVIIVWILVSMLHMHMAYASNHPMGFRKGIAMEGSLVIKEERQERMRKNGVRVIIHNTLAFDVATVIFPSHA